MPKGHVFVCKDKQAVRKSIIIIIIIVIVIVVIVVHVASMQLSSTASPCRVTAQIDRTF